MTFNQLIVEQTLDNIESKMKEIFIFDDNDNVVDVRKGVDCYKVLMTTLAIQQELDDLPRDLWPEELEIIADYMSNVVENLKEAAA